MYRFSETGRVHRHERRSTQCVLVVDDRAENRYSLTDLLNHAGYDVQDSADVLNAAARVRDQGVDLVLSDVRIEADDDGLRLLRLIKSELPHLPVILYTGFPTVGDAVRAMKLGASDYLEFPMDPDEIVLTVRGVIESTGATGAESDAVEAGSPPRQGIVAVSPAMRAVLDWATRIGRTDLPVLLLGETGTGKELVARALHAISDRHARPLVPVNCGAVPETLFEAELFGYRKGAFTGAFQDKPGIIEEAASGTLFLDEVGELSQAIQVRLLRFLDDGEIRRLGETKVKHVDVRVIAATNRPLDADVAAGRFRPDLYFRLRVGQCQIPPLRERLEDLDALVGFWLPSLASRLAPGVEGLTPGALVRLREHIWPGNVRELRAVLEHALCLASGTVITEREIAFVLSPAVLLQPAEAAGSDGPAERERVLAALQKHNWNLRQSAACLGVSRTTLWRHLKKYGISRIGGAGELPLRTSG